MKSEKYERKKKKEKRKKVELNKTQKDRSVGDEGKEKKNQKEIKKKEREREGNGREEISRTSLLTAHNTELNLRTYSDTHRHTKCEKNGVIFLKMEWSRWIDSNRTDEHRDRDKYRGRKRDRQGVRMD